MKKRLDTVVVERGLATDTDSAKRAIGAGEVYVNDRIVDKAGTLVKSDCELRLKPRCPFVSRGGYKLAAALQAFSISPAGRTCVDVGASTGGFTDCLLQNGAAKVYAVDVGYGLLAWKLRQDRRVTVLERCNGRHLKPADLGEAVEFAVTDVSFISLTRILPAMVTLFGGNPVAIVALLKPQFELPPAEVAKGGIVSDPALHRKARDKIVNFIAGSPVPLMVAGVAPSPIKGAKGNTEFLLYITTRP